MRVPICVPCRTLMEQRREGSLYVGCPKCGAWFPVANVTVNHKDGDARRTWVWQYVGKTLRWVRVTRGPLTAEKGREIKPPVVEPESFQARDSRVIDGAEPTHEIKDPRQGDPVPMNVRQAQWDRYGRCGFTDDLGARCRFVDNGHRFHLCVPWREAPVKDNLDRDGDQGSTVDA